MAAKDELRIAITGLVKSLMVAFRCVKGLRRSQWANLITVLFSVPINVYPVTWACLDVESPREDEETQGEMAFDPFAAQRVRCMACATQVLMDEQINSKSLRLQLAAVYWRLSRTKKKPESR